MYRDRKFERPSIFMVAYDENDVDRGWRMLITIYNIK